MSIGLAGDRGHGSLINDTVINVVALLKDDLGARRVYDVHLGELALADDIRATGIEGEVELIRLRDQILARGEIAGVAEIECVRCLRLYAQPFTAALEEEYRQTVDVRTGSGLRGSRQVEVSDDDDPLFTVDENHELDLKEAMRQNALLALPMRPDCGELCPGPDASALDRANDDGAGENANGFAALSGLLDDFDDADAASPDGSPETRRS